MVIQSSLGCLQSRTDLGAVTLSAKECILYALVKYQPPAEYLRWDLGPREEWPVDLTGLSKASRGSQGWGGWAVASTVCQCPPL